ncbi:MAG: putative lipid II flippase FtsW [Nitriliruptoraceae bacterium]
MSRRTWRTGPWTADATALTVVMVLLLVFGLVMSFSASFVGAATTGDPFAVFRRQATWASIGVVAFVAIAHIAPTTWRVLAWPLLIGSLAGLVAVLVPGVGVERFGSSRWIGIGPIVVQPSEVAKLGVLVWLADVLERKRPANGQLPAIDHLLVPALPLLGATSLLVMLQPDLGTAILLAMIVIAVLWIEGLPVRLVTWMAAGGTVIVLLLARVAPYRVARITGWLAPESDPLGSGFQLLQSRYALGSGGLWGLGLGSSRGKWQFLPNPETDFIFAIIGEELGLVGALAVLVLFSALLYLGLRIAFRAEHGFSRTVAFAITTWLVGQALVNIATVTGLLPITGVTLPLVSVGGSSLIVTLVALGMLVAIARTAPAAAGVTRQAHGGPR